MATILDHDVQEIVVGLPGSSGDNSIVDVLAVVTTDLRPAVTSGLLEAELKDADDPGIRGVGMELAAA